MRRFPVGLTIAAAIACAILIGLGVWQLHRLAWKEALLAKIAALRTAPSTPIAPVLARVARGEALEYVRVTVDCAPPARPSPPVFRYALRDGQVGWRLMTVCHLTSGPYDGILLDRGLVQSLAGAMAPSAIAATEPVAVIGILRGVGSKPLLGNAAPTRQNDVTLVQIVDAQAVSLVAGQSGALRPAPYFLAVERETPPPPGVLPAALPQDIPNNHYVYALTWFGLAGVLIWVYGAMLSRRLTGR